MDDACWLDAGQTGVEALEFCGESFVFDAHLVHERCVKVSYVDAVGNDVVSERAGLTVSDPPANAATGHPHAEASRMVVAAVIRRG